MAQSLAMQTPISDTRGQSTDLVRRAEAGEGIVLARHEHPAVRLVPVKRVRYRPSRRALLDRVWTSAATKPSVGASAARSQDFLYDEDGLSK